MSSLNSPEAERLLREITAWTRFLALHATCDHAAQQCVFGWPPRPKRRRRS